MLGTYLLYVLDSSSLCCGGYSIGALNIIGLYRRLRVVVDRVLKVTFDVVSPPIISSLRARNEE